MIQFKDLWRNHPTNRSDQFPCRVAKAEGGKRVNDPAYSNQCAIRIGIALKAAGVSRGQMSGAITCFHHSSDEMHFLRAEEVARAINGANIAGVGPREIIRGEDVQEFYNAIFGRRGIMLIKDYWRRSGETNKTGDHIDVWNGYRSSSGWLMEWFSWLGYYGGYEAAKEIWFWEVKQ